MPRLQLNKVHEYQHVPGTESEVRLVRMHPYVRIVTAGQPPLFVQDGMIFSEGGPVVPHDEIPDEFWAEISKTSAAQLEVVKFTIPDGKKVVQSLNDQTGDGKTRSGAKSRKE